MKCNHCGGYPIHDSKVKPIGGDPGKMNQTFDSPAYTFCREREARLKNLKNDPDYPKWLQLNDKFQELYNS